MKPHPSKTAMLRQPTTNPAMSPKGQRPDTTFAGIATAKPCIVPQDLVRARAYRKWELAGKPQGDGIRFWLEAEQELLLPSKTSLA
jgi:hypothetical protein